MLTISYVYTGSLAQEINLADGATPQQQTAAIQAALDAVAGHTGGAVSLSSGTFTVIGTGTAADGALRIGSETTLQGAGIAQTIIKLADGSTGVTGIVRTDSGAVLPDGSVSTTTNVVIQNLSIDGNKAHTTGDTDGFYSGPAPGTGQADSNITLERIEIMNASRYGFDPHEQTSGLTISNSVAHDNGLDGFAIDFCSNVQLINDTAYGNGRHGFNIVTGSSNVSIINPDAHDNGGSGIVVQTGDNEIRSFTNHVTISGGQIANNAIDGIDVHQATDVVIDQVAISGNGADGISLAGVERVDLSSNMITNIPAGSQAVQIGGYLQDFADSDQLNDRYVATHTVTIDGIAQLDPVIPAGVTLWSYKVTAGDDIITGSAGADTVAAGSGNDTVSGGKGNDTLYGNDGNDVLDGGAGNDVLYGGAGNDKLYGSAGNDTLKYTGGVDLLDGGTGFDTIDFSKFGSAVYVNLAAKGYEGWTSGTSSANAANATIAIADIAAVEAVKGSSSGDTIIGNSANNTLDGGGGYDTINGGAGIDTILGDRGNDTLNGGAGNDALTGGTGSDVFQLNAAWGTDTVSDFVRGQDKVEFAGVSGLTSFAKLAITSTSAGADVAYGTNHIILQGVTASTLTASDFLFH